MTFARLARGADRAVDRLREVLDRRARAQFERHPLCSAPMGTADEYLRRWHDARQEPAPEVDAYEQRAGAAVDREWFEQLALLTQVTIKKSATCYQHGRLLYATVRQYAARHPGTPLTLVETGTARGFATLCMARALDDARAPGKIVTFDVLPHDRPILWNCIRDVDGPRTRAELLRDYAGLVETYLIFGWGDTRQALTQLAFPRVHLAFLDSVHTYDHVMAEFAAIGSQQRQGDVIFFDDYTDAYPGVKQAADEICSRAGYRPTLVRGSAARAYLIAEKQ